MKSSVSVGELEAYLEFARRFGETVHELEPTARPADLFWSVFVTVSVIMTVSVFVSVSASVFAPVSVSVFVFVRVRALVRVRVRVR